MEASWGSIVIGRSERCVLRNLTVLGLFLMVVLVGIANNEVCAAKPISDGKVSDKITIVRESVLGDSMPGKKLELVSGVVTTNAGDVCVLDYGLCRVVRFDSFGDYVGEFGEPGQKEGQLVSPTAIAIDGSDRIYVVEVGGRISIFDDLGYYVGSFSAFRGLFANSLQVDADGNLIMSHLEHGESVIISKFDSKHDLIWSHSLPVKRHVAFQFGPTNVGGYADVDAQGDVYVSQLAPRQIHVVSASGGSRFTIATCRDEKIVPLKKAERNEEFSVLPFVSVTSSVLVLEGGLLLNSVAFPSRLKEHAGTLIELFENNGTMIGDNYLDDVLSFECQDRHGRVYATCNTDSSHVVKVFELRRN